MKRGPRMTKRAFWQIHLSTAIVLTFCAAGLLWMNTVCTVYACGGGVRYSTSAHGHGFPEACYWTRVEAWYDADNQLTRSENSTRIDGVGFIIDLAVAFIALFLIGWIIEGGTRFIYAVRNQT
jgi:hypothetical protein